MLFFSEKKLGIVRKKLLLKVKRFPPGYFPAEIQRKVVFTLFKIYLKPVFVVVLIPTGSVLPLETATAVHLSVASTGYVIVPEVALGFTPPPWVQGEYVADRP